MPRISSLSRLAATLALLCSCTGSIDGSKPPGTGPNPGTGPGPTPPGSLPPLGTNPTVPPGSAACKVNPGPSPLRRLTRSEYDNTVRDLLGDTSHVGRDFPQEERALGFDNNA